MRNELPAMAVCVLLAACAGTARNSDLAEEERRCVTREVVGSRFPKRVCEGDPDRHSVQTVDREALEGGDISLSRGD
jgi:hypothetical protein